MPDPHATQDHAAGFRAGASLYRFSAAWNRSLQRQYEQPTIHADEVRERLARKYRRAADLCDFKAWELDRMATR